MAFPSTYHKIQPRQVIFDHGLRLSLCYQVCVVDLAVHLLHDHLLGKDQILQPQETCLHVASFANATPFHQGFGTRRIHLQDHLARIQLPKVQDVVDEDCLCRTTAHSIVLSFHAAERHDLLTCCFDLDSV